VDEVDFEMGEDEGVEEEVKVEVGGKAEIVKMV